MRKPGSTAESKPDPELLAKVLSGEFQVTRETTQWEYAEIEFPVLRGWEPHPLNGSYGSGVVARVEDGKVFVELRRRHSQEKLKARTKQRERARREWRAEEARKALLRAHGLSEE